MNRHMVTINTRAGIAELSVFATEKKREKFPEGAVRVFTFKNFTPEYTCRSGKKMARLDFFCEEERKWGNIFLDLDHAWYGCTNQEKLRDIAIACGVTSPEDLVEDFHQMVASVTYKAGSDFPTLGDFRSVDQWRRLGGPKTRAELKAAEAAEKKPFDLTQLPF